MNSETSDAVERMKTLWRSNELLTPIVSEFNSNDEELADYFWTLMANGAGQWVQKYFVAVASLNGMACSLPIRLGLFTPVTNPTGRGADP